MTTEVILRQKASIIEALPTRHARAFSGPKGRGSLLRGDGRISALAKVDDPIFNVYVQTGIRRSGLFWYQNFIRNMEYKDLGTPEGRTGCSFGFTAYDQNGRLLVNVVKKD